MALDPVIGSVVGGIGAAIGGIGSGRRQRKNIREQKKADLELAEFSYGRDIEQWERENLYNAPEAQMGRFREAGLNPHLIYGKGTPGNVTSTSPKYQQVRTDYSQVKPMINPLEIIGAFQDIEMKNAQIDLVRKQGSIRGEEADFADIFYRGRATDVGYKGLQRRQQYKFGLRIQPGQRKSNVLRFHEYQLQMKEQQARGYKIGADIKGLEKEWLEWMKRAGIGAKLGIPLLRMFLR